MVSISKAYQDLNRTKSLINNLQREKAARYIETAAPSLLSNPQIANKEITTLSNIISSGADEHAIVEYLDFLTAKTDPETYKAKKQKEQMHNTRTRIGRWY